MRFCLIILVVLLIGLANARPQSSELSHQLRRLLKTYERQFVNREEFSSHNNYDSMRSYVRKSSNTPPVTSYQVLPILDDFTALTSQYTQLGSQGYTDAGSVWSGDYSTMGNIFVQIQKSSTLYDYHFIPRVTAVQDFLGILNKEGASGYRILITKYTTSGPYYILVRNKARPNAAYQCQTPPKSSNADDFVQQVKTQGANGYKLYGFGPQNTMLYCKDTSLSSTFEYVTTPFANFSADFESQVNELGAKGYRYSRIIYFAPVFVPLYYKDSSLPDVKYSYKVIQQSDAWEDFPQQLNEQGQEGFLYLGTTQFYYEEYSVQIYMDLNKCQCVDSETDYSY
ncbi:unnamed protein product [Adineta steineri]|uniref:Uncharacterized protein n=1 Tax=Adineta steineri TaxID=433720 RepID=A0A816D8Q0_9BILA|nr:unnamed protein product [Adineta steineri]CAF1634946.1 unnamed protein product [Adineta steineri]